ncbi:anti-sigma factor family protein [Cryptosporangium phraense]|uniref:Putative zinc-finger domain-containing protein n=1 Tax=Cryptosporangium phraense TaxID=2593070 RepID=A0A545AZB6_9ACTN|nr:zf-HC2 domain-containing protein [Cryptosporangium phraense]TQS46638.1 hypothetical protein FL583_04470 [Cryptosporangium phraense]
MTGPRRDPHLGELASAFADDALDLTTRDRVLVHLAHCAECRAEVEGHRQVKARLAKLESPPCPSSLLDRLRALPECTPAERSAPELTPPPVRLEASFRSVAPAGRPSGSRRPVAVPGRRRPAGRGPAGARPGNRRLRRKVMATAVGGVAAFAISLGTVVVLGGDQQPTTVNPPMLTYIKEHGATTGGVPGGDREASVVDVADDHE